MDCKIRMKTKLKTDYSYCLILIVEAGQLIVNNCIRRSQSLCAAESNAS